MTRRSGADEAGPANKRPKLEESDSGPPESRQPTQDAFGPRHDSLWLKDGSVIIAAVDLSFKVHSSVLGRHSSVFRELLDETGATGSAETFEGCRVLRVTDKGSTLADFLKILYDSGSSPFLNRNGAIPFQYLRGVTFLATKYKVHFIVNEAIARLETVFPVSHLGRLEESAYCWKSAPGALVHCDNGDCIAAVQLARSINAPNPPVFIVTAFYFACTHSIRDLAGFDYSDGESVRLSQADLNICLRAAEKLRARNSEIKEVLLELQAKQLAKPNECSYGYKEVNKCQAAFVNLIHAALRRGLFRTTAALSSCEDFLRKQIDDQTPRVCTACAAQIRKKLEEGRVETFNKLGEYFEIAPWPPQA